MDGYAWHWIEFGREFKQFDTVLFGKRNNIEDKGRGRGTTLKSPARQCVIFEGRVKITITWE